MTELKSAQSVSFFDLPSFQKIEMPMFSLVYKSQASSTLNQDAISKMLLKAQKSNEEKDITGCLLYHEGYFVQLLEGEENNVKLLYKKIRNDNRHTKVNLLSMEESVGRIFGTWHMIFASLNDNYASEQNQTAKRQLFDDIFHASDAVYTPGNSKLALWLQVNKLLSKNSSVTYTTTKDKRLN